MRPLEQQRILVTGSTAGAEVLVHGREPAKVEAAVRAAGAAEGLVDLMLERAYESYDAYAKSKLAQVLLTIELAERLRDRDVTVNALHPATLMDTKMVLESLGTPRSSVEQGVDAVLRVVADRGLDGMTGRFFDGTRESAAHRQAYDLTPAGGSGSRASG